MVLSIFSLLVFSIGTFFNHTAESMAEHTVRTQLGVRGQLLIDHVVEDLMQASLITIDPIAPVASTSLRFQKVTGVLNGDPVLDDPVHLDFDTGTNSVRRWVDRVPFGNVPGPEDEVVVLETKMAVDGIRFTRNGSVVFVDLDLETDSRGETYTFQISSAVKLRNVN